MPLLEDVIPALRSDAQLRKSKAYRLRRRRVVAIKLTSGAPCSSHGELFAPWPGGSEGVEKWFALDNGFAVGYGVDAGGRPNCSVIELEPDS